LDSGYQDSLCTAALHCPEPLIEPVAFMAFVQNNWLPQISVPALVVHGESDRFIPLANCKMIAERIPGAKLVMIPHPSHILSADQPEAVHHAILEFLTAQSSRPLHMQA
jgi:pimeloyl-ACP methyl ester carboxylesterase